MQLTEALKLKEQVEEILDLHFEQRYQVKDMTEYRNHCNTIDELNIQLTLIKDEIQKKNLKVPFRGTSNNARIYKLSNLAKEKKFYESLCTGRKPKTCKVITKDAAEARIKILNREMAEIQEQLTEFNKNTKVKIELKPILYTTGILKNED